MKGPLPPFSCTYSPNFPELLWQLNCTLVLSTYQAGKLIFVSASSPEKLIQLPRNFHKPMGVAMRGHQLAIAGMDTVTVFANSPELAKTHPKRPKTYDALFAPRATYYTGRIDLHDLDWGTEGLWAVNTAFSCLSLIDDTYSFIPKWKPSFISKFSPEDRCHLNGMAMLNGKPEYVSALGKSDVKQGWRERKAKGGILMHVPSGEILLENLPMPHSPRMCKGKLLMLLSATGELVEVDPKKGSYEVIRPLSGFVRGMAVHGDYLFVGLSKIRKTSSSFRDLPIASKSLFSGVVAIYIPHGSIAGFIRYETSVEELYDVQVLPNMRRPGILSIEKNEHLSTLMTPNQTYWAITSKSE